MSIQERRALWDISQGNRTPEARALVAEVYRQRAVSRRRALLKRAQAEGRTAAADPLAIAACGTPVYAA